MGVGGPPGLSAFNQAHLVPVSEQSRDAGGGPRPGPEHRLLGSREGCGAAPGRREGCGTRHPRRLWGRCLPSRLPWARLAGHSNPSSWVTAQRDSRGQGEEDARRPGQHGLDGPPRRGRPVTQEVSDYQAVTSACHQQNGQPRVLLAKSANPLHRPPAGTSVEHLLYASAVLRGHFLLLFVQLVDIAGAPAVCWTVLERDEVQQ